MNTPDPDITAVVQEHYGALARREQSGCGCAGGTVSDVARAIGYSEEEIAQAGAANLGLGCGNPLALAQISAGMKVLDLGSGAGFDAFLAWRKVGATGRVIGVDMTDDMLALASKNAADLGARNVEFRHGRIERLPVESDSVDLVISNCVINLSTDKPAVFSEIRRVLRPGGIFAVSDLVLLGKLPASVAADVNAYVGCVAGASLINDYIRFAFAAGFVDLSIPQITASGTLMSAYNRARVEAQAGAASLAEAAAAVISIKLHGRKPQV
jgi:arsenite methyltransferase